MKLFELFDYIFEDIETEKRLIVASPRFIKEYPKFVEKYPHFKANLRSFLLFRQTARPDQPFNAKDGRLTGGILQPLNLRRCHLVHGKAIVVYQTSHDKLKMITIGEHNDIEGKRNDSLATYYHSLSPDDYQKFDIPDDSERRKFPRENVTPLTPEEARDVKSLFLYFVRDPQGREILRKTAENDIGPFLDWARLQINAEDNSRDTAILMALDGRNMLVKRAKLWLEKTRDAYPDVQAAPEPPQTVAEPTPAPTPEPPVEAPKAARKPRKKLPDLLSQKPAASKEPEIIPLSKEMDDLKVKVKPAPKKSKLVKWWKD